MAFEAFLLKKRIDSTLFRERRPEEWNKLSMLFEKMGEKSFDQHKKFQFNPLRLTFPLKEIPLVEEKAPTKQEKLPLRKPITAGEEETNLAPPVKKIPLKSKPVTLPQAEENTEAQPETLNTPPPSVKKLPIKAKPVISSPEKEENTEAQPETLNTPPPSVKKLPIKAKLVISSPEKEENTEAQPEVLNTPPPSVKKLPLKAKPVISSPEKEENTEAQPEVLNTPPPSVKKLPLKAKPIIKNPEE